MLKLASLIATTIMVGVADARYVFNSRLASWEKLGTESSAASPQYKLYDDNDGSIYRIEVCYSKKTKAFVRLRALFLSEKNKTIIQMTGPSPKIIADNDPSNSCFIVLEPPVHDCITKIS